MNKKYCIVITGPTAVGKTAIAIQAAIHFSTSIISADSRQCFKELNIGVAKPSQQQLQSVPHYFINSHHLTEEVNASVFEQFALEKIHELFIKNDVVIMAGGTGMYIKAFCEGMDHIPAVPPNIREEITKAYQEKGLEWLQEEVRLNDPEFYSIGEIQNPQRLIRALEVKRGTGQSIISFRKGEKATRDFAIIKIGIHLPKEKLHQQINQRVDQMIEEGLEKEVRNLLPFKNLNALQTVGYSEMFDYFDSKFSLQQAIDLIKKNTRQYAKRQLTWFRRDADIKWFDASEVDEIIDYCEQLILV